MSGRPLALPLMPVVAAAATAATIAINSSSVMSRADLADMVVVSA